LENLETASHVTLGRMPIYLKALHAMRDSGKKYVSSIALAEAVRENSSLVKKDLSYAIKSEGKPRVGYEVAALISDIEDFLGYKTVKNAVIVGVGKLGQALMGFGGFAKYGLNIVAGFDTNQAVVGAVVNGKPVLDFSSIKSYATENGVKIGIITTPKQFSQGVANELVEGGIRAIWNFTSRHLSVPNTVAVRNEDMASGLAILSKQLDGMLKKEDK